MRAQDRRALAYLAGGALFSLGIVKGTKIGPVIFTVSERYGLGVHTGDFLAVPVAATAVALAAREWLKVSD